MIYKSRDNRKLFLFFFFLAESNKRASLWPDTAGRRFRRTFCIKWSDFQRNRSMSRIFWRGNATSELCATTTMTNVAKLDQNNIIAEI